MFGTIALQGGGAVAGLFGLLLLLAQIALIYWTYTDAKSNSDQPALLWAVVVLLAPLLGLVLYFLLGRGKA